jgi:hypothetical protein
MVGLTYYTSVFEGTVGVTCSFTSFIIIFQACKYSGLAGCMTPTLLNSDRPSKNPQEKVRGGQIPPKWACFSNVPRVWDPKLVNLKLAIAFLLDIA